MTQATQHARQFTANRAVLIDLYNLLPDDQGDFSAWDGGMGFIKMADHLSGSATRMVDMIGGQGMDAPAPASANLDEARDRLRQTHQTVVSAVEALSDEDLTRTVPAFGGREMPVAALLDMLTTHEAHHKGQVWMMARMVGVQPPMFVKLG
ncbi:DinB family protein [Deinococcus arenicola]|uniref:DinB family protein n=1 Tax=Deinococcus arenicola TaxID=2994950 RepID=A0ABU4DSA4_9DEIO|nr:DinB family protein [Deinococcus sp. ZS9-10]MDV6374569.1 DinB family protein [Deinococcus sp. ZS9-10]